MAESNVGSVVVVDEGVLVGLLSERDLVRRVIMRRLDPARTRVADVMSHDVICVTEDTPVDEAMELVTRHRTRHLPVVSDTRVLGVVSIGDLVHCQLEERDRAIGELQHYVPAGTPSDPRARGAAMKEPVILVVDDDEAVRTATADVLVEEGLKVDCACDGSEALRRMREAPVPSLVLLDLMMPRMSGWQVLDAMSSQPDLTGIPVIVLTAFDAREDLPVDRKVLHKPIDADVLCDLVRHVLEGGTTEPGAAKSPRLRASTS
jgi:CheY-like chemotaxis protein